MARLSNSLEATSALWKMRSTLTWRRVPFILLFSVAAPLATVAAARAREPDNFGLSLVVGAALFGAVMITHRIGLEVSFERMLGQHILLATSGISHRAYLGALVLHASALAVFPAMFIAVASLTFDLQLPKWHWLIPFFLAYLTLASVFLCVGSCIRETVAVRLVTNGAMALILGLCPLFYPPDRVPEPIRAVVDVLPPTVAVELLTRSWSTGLFELGATGILAAWAIVLTAVACWRFRWTA